ncbi:flippase [Thermodesulfovibrio sp. TK110]
MPKALQIEIQKHSQDREHYRNITQRTLLNLWWSIVGEGISRGIFFLSSIYLARTLGVSNFGLFTLAQTVAIYFWLFSDLGINMYGIREIAKDKKNAEKIINPLFTIRITIGMIIFLLYVFALSLINISLIKKLTFIGCGLYIITYAFYPEWILKGLEKFKLAAYGIFVTSLFFILGLLFFIKDNKDIPLSALIWSLSYGVGGILLFCCIYKKIHIKYKPIFNLRVWFNHLRDSVYFTTSAGLILLYQYLPIFLLSIFFDTYEVGLFSAPYKIVTSISIGGSIILMAFYPVFSDLYHKDREEFKKIHRTSQKIILSIGISIGIVGILWGDKIINLFFGIQYAQSALGFSILILVVPVTYLRYTYGMAILAMGFQRAHNIATFIGVLCMCISGLFLIPKFSIVGGAISVLLSEIATGGSLAIIFYNKLSIRK